MNSSLAVDTSLESRLWPSLLSLLDAEQSVIGQGANHLFKRTDVCTQAFGAGWTTTTCSPSSTLCCLNQNSNYPQCQQYLGAGWCCVAYQSNCYIDLTSTSCDADGSVPCTELAAGTKQACCLPNTTCASGYNASSTYARCNIQQLALQALASPSTSSSTTSSTTTSQRANTRTSSTITTTSTSTSLTSTDLAATSSKSTAYGVGGLSATSSTATLPSATSQSGGGGGTTTSLSAGAIAGIAIGPVLAVLLILLLAFFIWRRRSRKRKLENAGPVAQYHDLQPQPGPDVPTTYYGSAYHQNNAQEYYGVAQEKAPERVEMSSHPDAREMAADTQYAAPAELEATSRK